MKKNAEIIRTRLIKILADGQFHSGENLGKVVGVTRSAIANHMKNLLKLGVDVFSVKGRGYKLSSPLNMLDENLILSLSKTLHKGELHVANIIASTNDYVKTRLPDVAQGFSCTAEAQTKGRGRRGRTWISPYGASVYLSMGWRFSGGYQSMAGLSLLVGIAINRCLQKMKINDAKLKWPNDVYVQGKKLSGILIEVEGQVGADTFAVIGIGINVCLPQDLEGIDQPFIDLQTVCAQTIDRNLLIARVIDQLREMLLEFEQHGLKPFMQEWQSADLFYDKPIKLIAGNNQITGISKGINDTGALMLETNGHITAHYGGEISVRAL